MESMELRAETDRTRTAWQRALASQPTSSGSTDPGRQDRGSPKRGSELVRSDDHGQAVLGRSQGIAQTYALLRRVAVARNTTVLIRGESGAGKEVAAQAIHKISPRAECPFVAINCAALTESLLESELFGYERGAFSGAHQRKIGLFEAAHGGTLLLDEIGDMPLGLQAKLLRVLQERQFFRVGGIKPVQVDVRILSSTNRDLAAMVAEGSFRPDLFYRLNVIRLQIPALRDRPEDVQPLAEAFLSEFSGELGRTLAGFSPAALARLRHYPWPGNVRELRNVVERAAILAAGSVVQGEDLLFDDPLPSVAEDARVDLLEATLAEVERVHITRVLDHCQGNKTRAARKLQIHRTTLAKKMSDYGLLGAC